MKWWEKFKERIGEYAVFNPPRRSASFGEYFNTFVINMFPDFGVDFDAHTIFGSHFEYTREDKGTYAGQQKSLSFVQASWKNRLKRFGKNFIGWPGEYARNAKYLYLAIFPTTVNNLFKLAGELPLAFCQTIFLKLSFWSHRSFKPLLIVTVPVHVILDFCKFLLHSVAASHSMMESTLEYLPNETIAAHPKKAAFYGMVGVVSTSCVIILLSWGNLAPLKAALIGVGVVVVRTPITALWKRFTNKELLQEYRARLPLPVQRTSAPRAEYSSYSRLEAVAELKAPAPSVVIAGAEADVAQADDQQARPATASRRSRRDLASEIDPTSNRFAVGDLLADVGSPQQPTRGTGDLALNIASPSPPSTSRLLVQRGAEWIVDTSRADSLKNNFSAVDPAAVPMSPSHAAHGQLEPRDETPTSRRAAVAAAAATALLGIAGSPEPSEVGGVAVESSESEATAGNERRVRAARAAASSQALLAQLRAERAVISGGNAGAAAAVAQPSPTTADRLVAEEMSEMSEQRRRLQALVGDVAPGQREVAPTLSAHELLAQLEAETARLRMEALPGVPSPRSGPG